MPRNNNDFRVGLSEGFSTSVNSNDFKALVKEQRQEFQNLGKEINKSLVDSFAEVIKGTKNAKGAFHDFSRSVLDDMQKMAAKNLAESSAPNWKLFATTGLSDKYRI